jgi:anti-anti-sigma factor
VRIPTTRLFRPDPRTIDQRETRHRGRFSARHLPASTVVIAVEGDIDAANDRFLVAYIERQICGSAHLVLDLTHVDFFGTAGFAALHHVNVICSQHGISWVVSVGPQLSRLLTICDPDGCLPLDKQQSVPLPLSRTN